MAKMYGVEIRYWVNCFDRELVIKFPKGYEWLEEEILDLLDDFYMEWHSPENIEDEEIRRCVEDSCCEEYMMERLSEIYNMWEDWWVEDESEEQLESEHTINVRKYSTLQDTLGRTRGTAVEILELFEDLLERHNIYIPDDDRDGNEGEACIYGSTYAELEDEICQILSNYIDE